MLTVFLSVLLLRERASKRAWIGIAVAAPVLVLLSYVPPSADGSRGASWLILCLLVFAAWGIQAHLMKFANETMRAESIFFYMAVTALMLIPGAIVMTGFAKPVNWGLSGVPAAGAIQILKSIGALCLVYAMRYGKPIIVTPMTAMSPVLTIFLSLALYRTFPGPVLIAGMALASACCRR